MMNYKNQTVLLASKHEKEKAIAEVFLNKLSCTLCVHDFDTDAFGTFTGEIPRPLNPFETCILKAKTAAEQLGYELAVANEGSFGPHPAIPFMPAGHEIMVFVDRKNDWIISEQLVTNKTNYSMMTIDVQTKLDDFLNRIGFPEHAVIVQTNKEKKLITKGIKDFNTLNAALEIGFHQEQELFIATDMRAMMNPTRMGVIRELADNLANRIARCCPACRIPGFGFKKTEGHLTCSSCDTPTSLYKQELWGCIECDFIEIKPRKDQLNAADPTYCDYCNP